MRNNRILSLLLVLVTIVFVARFLSRASVRAARPCMNMPASLGLVFCDPEAATGAGRRMLEKNERAAGMVVLSKALRSSPLDADIYLMLGRFRLYAENIRDREFEQGLSDLRTAARLGGSRDDISAEAGLQMLGLWPHLDENERRECERLLIRGIRVLDTDTLVRTWWRYAKDRELLASVLEPRPKVMPIAADTLTRLGAPLTLRWRLLAANERLEFSRIRSEYSDARLSAARLKAMAGRMEAIVGYASLVDPDDPDWQRYTIFRERLLLEALENALRQYRHHPGPEALEPAIELLKKVLRDTRNVDLIGVESMMAELGVWAKTTDPEDFLLQARLSLRTGNYSRALELSAKGAEIIEKSIPALLVAARAAMAMKLMIVARGHLQRILEMDPTHREAKCLMRIIQGELRLNVPQDETNQLKNLCRVTVGGGAMEQRIPMIPGEQIVVAVNPVNPGIKRLLHLRVEGRVVLEQYISSAGERISIPMDTLGIDPGETIALIAILTTL